MNGIPFQISIIRAELEQITQVALVTSKLEEGACKWQIAVDGVEHSIEQQFVEQAICEVRMRSVEQSVRMSYLYENKLYRNEWIVDGSEPVVLKGVVSPKQPLSLEFSSGATISAILSLRGENGPTVNSDSLKNASANTEIAEQETLLDESARERVGKPFEEVTHVVSETQVEPEIPQDSPRQRTVFRWQYVALCLVLVALLLLLL